jgi:group I intron endonuclease
MNSQCAIYAITNGHNGKVYVGQSTDVDARRSWHFAMLRSQKHPNRHLQSSVIEHGIDGFTFDVVEYCEETLLDERERAWIERLASTDPRFGYNLDSGGSMHHRHSPETCRKISEANRGRRHSDESREKMSASRRGKPSSFLGCHFSPAALAKLSASHIGIRHSDATRQKMSESRRGQGLGRKLSAETCLRLSESHRNPSPETRKKRSDTQRGRPWSAKRRNAQNRKTGMAPC